MGIKSTIETGIMLFIGVIALKAFGGVKGLTDMFQGMGDLFGTGSAAGYTGSPVTGDVITDVIEGGGTVDIIETAARDPFNPWALLSPAAIVGEGLRYISQQPATTITTVTGAAGPIIPSCSVIGVYPTPAPFLPQPMPVEDIPKLESPISPIIGIPEQWRGIFE